MRELNPVWVSATQYSGSWNAYGAVSSTGTPTSGIPQYRYVTKEWHEDQGAVDRNNELIAAVGAQQVLLWEAARACANKIRALYGAAALRSYQSENDPNGYGLDEIPEGTEMPWGAPVERTEGCGEATFNFVVKDFLWGEAEFLFQRGTSFEVVSKFQDSAGVWRIHLREVDG
ncbi:hypothetical protein AB1K54_15965 [Microbacterium sp. BWT-B31]|uniref:hypothetical protein n=1 Tax=Microbacterium sp. BWT-B31 TaxID=3232072 RepID=UPI0035277A16